MTISIITLGMNESQYNASSVILLSFMQNVANKAIVLTVIHA
jgi:hypothetical protein